MPLPTPAVPLDSVCSAIFNNTLYTYSSKALQSLELSAGAEWKMLPMGVPVDGGVCVKTTPVNNTDAAALWIVGGNSTNSDYQGLQRYNFMGGNWETLQPSAPVTQNRLYHGAAYLNSSDSVLVFAGTQDGSRAPSSQTFTIQATEPYQVLAFEAEAPPAIGPVVIPMTQSKAIYVGGSEANTKVMVFSPSKSWVDSNATLATPFYNCSSIKATLQNGNDASKTLYTYDMTVKPGQGSQVNRTVLFDGEGNPVHNSAPIVSTRDLGGDNWEQEPSLYKRGNLTVENWPAYNKTFAPSSVRSSYSVARDQSGMTVLVGGNKDDVLCIFKARDNCWLNATAKLTSKAIAQQGPGELPSSPDPSDSASASSTPTADAAAPTSANTPPFPVQILASVLGAFLGGALILVALLLFFRWRKKRSAGHQRRASGIPGKSDEMDFKDRGLPQMSSTRQYRGHAQQDSQSSMAILMGRVQHKRGAKGDGGVGSDSISQFNTRHKTEISKPIPQDQTLPMPEPSLAVGDDKANPYSVPRPSTPVEEKAPILRPRGSTKGGRRGSTRRSSGWNRYWSGGSDMNILGFGSKRSTYEGGSERSSQSQYSDHRPSAVTQVSAMVPPLKIPAGAEMHRVVSGSPTIGHSGAFPLTREMTGKIETSRSGSVSSLSSYGDRNDAFSSGIPASINEAQNWTPVEQQNWTERASSNVYSESNYAPTVGRSTVANPIGDRYTRFPGAEASQKQSQTSDMSWLNLGANSKI